jgi:hypothetical protein
VHTTARAYVIAGCVCAVLTASALWPRGSFVRDVVLGSVFLALCWSWWSVIALKQSRRERGLCVNCGGRGDGRACPRCGTAMPHARSG